MALLLLASASGAEATMQVWPTRVYFEVSETTQVLNVRNSGDKPLTIQASPRAWSADPDGGDHYEDTDDLLVFPRMATIDPGADQILRLAYRGSEVVRQRAFRILVEELPQELMETGESGMSFTVTLSVPIFIDPAEKMREFSLDVMTLKEGTLELSVLNNGTVHEQVKEIAFTLFDAKGTALAEGSTTGWYVLPGHKRTFKVAVPQADCRKAARISLTAVVGNENQMPLAGEMAIQDPSECTSPPKTQIEPVSSAPPE